MKYAPRSFRFGELFVQTLLNRVSCFAQRNGALVVEVYEMTKRSFTVEKSLV